MTSLPFSWWSPPSFYASSNRNHKTHEAISYFPSKLNPSSSSFFNFSSSATLQLLNILGLNIQQFEQSIWNNLVNHWSPIDSRSCVWECNRIRALLGSSTGICRYCFSEGFLWLANWWLDCQYPVVCRSVDRRTTSNFGSIYFLTLLPRLWHIQPHRVREITPGPSVGQWN